MNDKIIARFGLISFLATIAIKGVIRPMHLEMNESSQYLVGVLPNFFAATGFCAIFYI
jgi:hypothetical protein